MDNFKRERRLHPQLYIGQLSSGDQGWSAYLHPSKSGYIRDTIDLDRAFKERGSFLFSSKEIPVHSKEMADHLVTFVQNYIKTKYGTNNSCLLWSNDFNNDEGIYGMAFFNGKLMSPVKFPVSSSLTLHWEKDCSVSYDPAKKCISIKGPAGVERPMGIGKDYPNGKDFPFQETRLSFDSAGMSCLELGCLEFDLTLSLNGDFDELDFALRYFAYDKINKKVCSQRYPLFCQAGGYVGLKVRMDPTCYLNPDRSFWAFAQASSPLTSSFITTLGQRVMMAPVSAACPSSSAPARMVFARKSPSLSDDLYLVPQGDFNLAVQESPSDATTFSLVCGLEGTEFVVFSPGDRMRFRPDQPAYAGDLPLDPVSPPKTGRFLESLLTTSWITIVSGSSNQLSNGSLPVPRYDTQPKGAPLYSEPKDECLRFHEAGTAIPNIDGFCFPMVPYSMLQIDPSMCIFSPNGVKDFESSILSPARKSEIYRNRIWTGGTNPISCATPQGFILKVKDNGSYSEVCLAQTEGEVVSFSNPQPRLQDALQTNQLFLVVTQNTLLGELVNEQSGKGTTESKFFNAISLGGWDFQVNVPKDGNPGDYRNVMIFKFCRGKLSDLVMSPSSWTNPEIFNETKQLSSISQWLKSYIDDAMTEHQGDKYFKKFQSIVSDENWNGVLFLRVDVTSVPEQMAGVLAGIDLKRFSAHHLGIEMSQVDASQVKMMDGSISSTFGLIYYFHPLYAGGQEPIAPPSGVDYHFQVLTLQALFENSAVKDFESLAQLTINKIFNHTVFRAGNNQYNSIMFRGSCQDNGGVTTYMLDMIEECSLYLGSNVLRKVELIKAQMSMAEVSGSSGRSSSRFDFWGFMDFSALKCQAQTAGTTSAQDQTHSANFKPVDTVLRSDFSKDPCVPAWAREAEAFSVPSGGVRLAEGRDADRILVDMEVSNDIGELPETFVYTVAVGRAESQVELPSAAGAGISQTRLFDILSFGSNDGDDQPRAGLSFSGLGLRMTSTGSDIVFLQDLSKLSFDVSKSTPRSDSIYRSFALELEGFISGDDNSKPEDAGFLEVQLGNSGPDLSGLSGAWSGLQFRLNMGSPGELAGKAGLQSSLLMAWSDGDTDDPDSYKAMVGIKLPGTSGVSLFDIQGIIKLSIGDVRLICIDTKDQDQKDRRSFMLVLTQIALKIFGLLKIPPVGATSFYLFGNPDAGEKASGLGWYAIYKKEITKVISGESSILLPYAEHPGFKPVMLENTSEFHR